VSPVSPVRPLDGVVVVSMEQAVSAPFATRHLADQGARVIKIERPDGGDFARDFDTLASGLGTHFTWVNRGKESVTLDTKHPAAHDILFELLDRADVFVQNLAPGAAPRVGLDGPTLLRRFPRLIVCEISGYGTSGPYAERRAYDLLVQAEAAIATVTGSIEDPVKPGIAVADIAAGMYGYSAVLTALLARSRSGCGTVLEVAMIDAVAEWMGYAATVVKHGGTPVFGKALSHPAIAPYDAYRTSDGQRVVLSVQNDREWVRLATDVLARPDLAHDARFASNAARVRNRDEIDRLLGRVLAALDLDAAIATLTAAGIACGRIATVQQLVDHPQLVSRDRWTEMDSPVGTIPTLLPPVLSSAWTPAVGAVPALGEHTDAVLRELGRSTAEIARLHEERAV
jgi:crotonobetainyl-CoA:carnitine CoA-transferase CaiB-like acyl-CoA transferase